ncbi:MAG: DnaJ domain-containing protein [Syntrophales bacterium]|jgi:curved DNA-binding protein CbpA
MKYPWQIDWKDYYQVLQIIPEAESEVIDGAYKRLVTKYHPDNKKTGDADKFRLIYEAHEILADPAKKKEYDAAYQDLLKDRDQYQIIPEKFGVQDSVSQKIFCSDSFCKGVINKKGFCTMCKKAYVQEAQREIKKQPEMRIIDEDI